VTPGPSETPPPNRRAIVVAKAALALSLTGIAAPLVLPAGAADFSRTTAIGLIVVAAPIRLLLEAAAWRRPDDRPFLVATLLVSAMLIAAVIAVKP
jgi:hypothetical protein